MLRQAVGIVASIVAAGVVGLCLACLVRLSWGPPNNPEPHPTAGPDKSLP